MKTKTMKEWGERKYRRWIYNNAMKMEGYLQQRKQELDLYLAYAPAPVCSVSVNSFWRARSIISAKVFSPLASVEFPVAAWPSVVISAAASSTVSESASSAIAGGRLIKRRMRRGPRRKRHIIASLARRCVRLNALFCFLFVESRRAFAFVKQRLEKMTKHSINDGIFATSP